MVTYLIFCLSLVLLDNFGEAGRWHYSRHHTVAARVVLKALGWPLSERELTVHLFPLVMVLNHAVK